MTKIDGGRHLNIEYVEELIGQEYEKWEPGDNVMILAGTGKGKSHFIRTVLNKHCRNTKKRVLLLTNRNILKEQVRKELGLNTIITVANYQQIESMILDEKNLNEYDYIVMDEAHYFFTDASFNIKTDIFFEWMLNNESACKVFMTATPFVLLQYFRLHDVGIRYRYELPTDYSYLSNIYMFDDYKTIEGIIEGIPEDEQILFISRSAKRAYEISKKFKGAFICSKTNDEFKKYINQEEIDNIIKKSMFQSHLLCATTVLDNGINIKEFTNVKHVIIDIFDRDTFIQCLGRKRVGQGETITLYFKNYDRRQVNGFKSRLVHGLKLADTLIELGEEQYIKKSFKKDIFYKFNFKIIDDKWNDDKGTSEKVVNKCMYHKYQHDLGVCNAILSKSSNKVTFKDIIAKELNVDRDRIVDMEITEEKLTLEEYLSSIIGEKLFKDEQKLLKQVFERNGLKARTLGINTLNGYMKDNKIYFIIETDREKSRSSGLRDKRYWSVKKVIV
jgi:hypothetical protein